MTAPSYHARLLSPILPVEDIARSIRFYEEVLGFESVMKMDGYGILQKGAASIHLTKAADQDVLDSARGHMSFYLEVEDIDGLWNYVSQFKDRYKIRDLFDREYGMREFHIADPDDCLVFVGQKL